MAQSRPFVLVDLYFPAHAATPEEVLIAAEAAGLDAVVLVAESVDDLPDAAVLAELSARGRCKLHAACAVSGAGFRFALLSARGYEGMSLESIESAGDPKVVQAAAHALGGVALPVSPRQGGSGEVQRQVAPLPSDPAVGMVALVIAGSRLGRDLDIEDAGIAQRRVLAATGPFGQLADLGRYATVLPGETPDLIPIIGALQRGLGVAIELVARRAPSRPPVDPREGRDDEREPASGGKKKRRRRRRARKEDGGAAAPEGADGGSQGGDGDDDGGGDDA